jgi:MFS family permease
MIEKTLFKPRLYFTGIITIFVGSLLAWDYYHGGVPTHHILQRADLPGISNWWGAVLLPLITWFRIQKRVVSNDNSQVSKFPKNIIYGFTGALIFGITLSLFFTLGTTEMPFYMLIGLLFLALFFPIYRAECLLGFFIGMTFTFGGVLPVAIGAIFVIIGAMVYLLVRPAIIYVVSRFYLLSNQGKGV